MKKYIISTLICIFNIHLLHATNLSDFIGTQVFIPNKEESKVISYYETYKIDNNVSFTKTTVAVTQDDGDLSFIFPDGKLVSGFLEKLMSNCDPSIFSRYNILLIELTGLVCGPDSPYKMGYIIFEIGSNKTPLNIQSGVVNGKYGREERIRMEIGKDNPSMLPDILK